MYAQALDQLFAKLGDHAFMCLATSKDDCVTARSVSVLVDHRKFYFQSDVRLRKCRQIEANPNVALCWQNVQIIGACRAIGHPLLTENAPMMKLYRQHFAGSYEKYSALADEMLFEIAPRSIQVWNYNGEKPYQEFFDLSNESYRREDYALDD